MSTRELIAFAKRKGVVFGVVDDRLVVTGLRRLSKRRQGEVRAAREAIKNILVPAPNRQEPATPQALVDSALVSLGLPAGALRVNSQGGLTFEMTGGRADDVLREAAHSIAPILAAMPEPEPLPPDAKLPHGKITIWR